MSEVMTRRALLRRSGALAAVAGSGSLLAACASSGSGGGSGSASGPIKVGVVTDLTGPLSFGGKSDAHVATLVVDQWKRNGGVLGRPVQLIVRDAGSQPQGNAQAARQLVQGDRVDMVLGGITSAEREAIVPVVAERGQTIYIYPQLYEGGACGPNIFCTGPVPNQQIDPWLPWLMRTGAKRFYLPGSDYVWPHALNALLRKQIPRAGGQIVGEEYFPLDATSFGAAVNRIMSSKTDVVFLSVIPPGFTPFVSQLYEAGFQRRGGRIACPFADENLLNAAPASQLEGTTNCLDFFEDVNDPFSKRLVAEYKQQFPDWKSARFAAGSASSGTYRGLELWRRAVETARSTQTTKVRPALEHASIPQGPGGAAQIAGATHHTRLDMYIAQAHGGRFQVVESLGPKDPQTC